MNLNSLGSTGSTLAQTAATRDGAPSPLVDFRSLASALRTGDLAAAQKAFAALSQRLNVQSAASGAGADLQAVGSALRAGDITGARRALGALLHHVHGAHRPRAASDGSGGAAAGTLNLRI